MKIKNLEMTNFCGIKGSVNIEMPHVAALVGKNGMGKTSILNAIRYALTGAEPEGDIIHAGCDACRVSITLTDSTTGEDMIFTREKDREKPSKFKIDGKATTQKAMNEKIEQIIGIPLDKVKILSSGDVVASMKPQEMASFILDYIPEKLSLDKVIEMLDTSTLGVLTIMEANLPEENIDLEVLDGFAEFCKASRKELKSRLSILEKEYASLPKEFLFKLDELEKRLKELSDIENKKKIYDIKKDAYDKALDAVSKQKEQIKKQKEEAGKIEVSRPNPAEVETLKKKLRENESSIQNLNTSVNGIETSINTLKRTLEVLNKPICPVSPLITCSQDKSVAKAEIEESIKTSEEGKDALLKELDKLKEEKILLEKNRESINAQTLLYTKKIEILKSIKMLEDSMPELPEKPEEIVVEDVSKEREEILHKINLEKDYEKGLEFEKKIKNMKTELSDFETLCKATAEKGCIRNGILESYLSLFEELCNSISKKVRPEIEFRFVSDNGVVILMNNGKGAYLPYSSLSGGEKAYMIFIIIDMLSKLSGTNLLLLDELSVIDEECFDALLDIINEYKDEFDHIIIAAVNHDDTVRSLEKKGIEKISTIKEDL